MSFQKCILIYLQEIKQSLKVFYEMKCAKKDNILGSFLKNNASVLDLLKACDELMLPPVQQL